MYALKNKVQLIGNLGNAPDVRTTETGKKWARFSVATNETYRNVKGDKVTETQWHNLVAWGKVAEIVEKYLGKLCQTNGCRCIHKSSSQQCRQRSYIDIFSITHTAICSGRKRNIRNESINNQQSQAD